MGLTVTGWFTYTQLHAWQETAEAESIRVPQLVEEAGAVLHCAASSSTNNQYECECYVRTMHIDVDSLALL